jgi:hypothetical protein
MEAPDDILGQAYGAIRNLNTIIRASSVEQTIKRDCKQELYHLQCWLNDEYKKLPVFVGEEKWEQDRIVKILKE